MHDVVYNIGNTSSEFFIINKTEEQNIVHMLYNGYVKEAVSCYLLLLFLAFKKMKTVY